MKSNAILLLEKLVEREREELAPSESASDFFELFVCDLVLREFGLDDTELADGLVDGTDDGGIDAAYVLVDGRLVSEPGLSTGLRVEPRIQIVCIQANLAGFSESKILSATKTMEDLLTLGEAPNTFTRYNSDVVRFIQTFRDTYASCDRLHPRLDIRYLYGAPAEDVHPKAAKLLAAMKARLTTYFDRCEVRAEALTARRLLDLHGRARAETVQLRCDPEPLAVSHDGLKGYIGLVPLESFARFIREDSGDLRRRFLEPNVRDDQGMNEVNKAIASTLGERMAEDFWWLNNGITILSPRISREVGGTLHIDNPQIVNGLQTTMRLYEHFRSGVTDSGRRLLVKALETDDPESADRVIRATNSQTAVRPWALRATDEVQKDIEKYFEARGLYYDRRARYQRNQGRPLAQIVSIARLGQAVLATTLGRPNDARARPTSSLLKSYPKIFDHKYPLEMFRVAIEVVRRVDAYLRGLDDCPPARRADLLYYVARWVVALAAGASSPTPRSISNINLDEVTEPLIAKGYRACARQYDRLGGTDRVAKGPELVTAVEQDILARVKRSEPRAHSGRASKRRATS